MLSPTTRREGLLRVDSLPCLCTYLQPWRGTQHVVFDRFELAQPHECSSKAATCHANIITVCASLQQHLTCTEDVTDVRRTLQRLQIDVFSGLDCIFHVEQHPSSECQLIDILFSLLSVSTYCHRGRHRCDTVIHASLQPTRGLCLKADLNFWARPSGTPSPTTHDMTW